MTLRKNPSKSAKKTALLSLSDFEEGQKVVAVVRKVEAYGMFLKIEGSNVSGLCHKSEVTDNRKADVAQALKGFREGDQVKAKIVSIDTEKGKISFGIKASYFGEDFEGGEKSEEEDDDAEEENDGELSEGDQEMESGDEESGEGEEDEDEDEDEEVRAVDGEDEEASSDEEEIAPQNSKPAPKTALNLGAGFDWTGEVSAAAPESDDESDSDEEVTAPAKSKGKSKAVDLTATAPSSRPSSTAEYERALLASPNSSFLWIQYMSFHLQLHEIEKARKIGRQALEKISYREEDEKLNVWMALINLEIAFGTVSATEKVFEEAAQYNDKRTVYMRYAEALQVAGKDEVGNISYHNLICPLAYHVQALEELFKKIVKKFSAYPESWTRFAEFYLNKSDVEAARALLPRSMKSLDRSKRECFLFLRRKLGN